ncbi:hypothetical protein, variant [Verruconis gallopava]|uniref:Mediator of RNA polymerase II transcription subunit 1 n=1 Tax=Verruconis gallopava TaxID=253628 RepID=A0A0D2B8I5_9PEZI|nr:uncharacterized protein PV09_01478 [Verruconis gallopava]XP_016217383.1 hypothetical protein, variant [Verruconis gallopava]KIW07513.1 hypothetical protein PV09_01478 [Verruconis gallopava]KIW07514.1 hypothetical protein, variant [Verruconis gallopava]
MATPNASNNPTKGAHNAATPQSQPLLPNFTSPAPRSVPSPAAQRQSGKSPFAASTQAQSASSTTAQNHPTVGSSGSASKHLLGSSPAAGVMNFESPMPMSFSLSQMGNVEGGVPMAPGMSGLSALGLMPITGLTDEEKWRRLNDVMERLKARPGRVSLDNLRALGKRLGFEEMLEQPRTGNTILSFAGRTVLVEMTFTPEHELKNVDVQFQEPSPALQKTAASASKVFHDCLTVPPGLSSITHKLNKFAANLEKLAKIDKPHGAAGDGFNGFEAIAGIYNSLFKLYNHELSLAKQLYAGAKEVDEKAMNEVTCKKSGRPRMNEGRKIGLDLDYWITRRHLTSSTAERSNSATDDSVDNGSFTLSILCEALQADHITQPARISDAWISDQIEKAPDGDPGTSEPVIDWLEPPPTYLSPSVPAESTGKPEMEQTPGKLPDVRFVAKLCPPLLIPAHIAAQNGISQDFMYQTLPSYITSLLHHANTSDSLSTIEQMPLREIYAERIILSKSTGGSIRHANTLRIRSLDQSILLHEIPFDHPKQLIQLLPMLRQFAYFNAMLKTSFPTASTPIGPVRKESIKDVNRINNIDMTFSSSPSPRVVLTFARGVDIGDTPSMSADNLDEFFSNDTLKAGLPVSVSISVLPNAEIVIGENNIITDQKRGKVHDELNEKLSRALDLAADLNVWVEYVKMHVAK